MLTPQQLHAIAIAGKRAADVRDQLETKAYRVDFGVQVTGQLIVSDSQTVASTAAIRGELLIAALLEQFGPRKRKAIVSKLIADADRIRGAKEVEASATAEAERLIRETIIRGTQTRRGAVTGKFDLQLL